MAEITISPLGPREFEVQVREGERETTHRVTVPDEPEFGDQDLERVVRESFDFLLEREPASSILSRFSLTDISTYFPEYSVELPRRLP
jgi:hypothetical protein